MLNADEVRQITFANYSVFISFAKDAFKGIKQQGLEHDELVNEGILNVFDNLNGFKNQSELIDFIKKSIKTAGFHLKEQLKDANFLSKKSNDNTEYSILDKEVKYHDTPTDEFIRVYEIFERSRFGKNNELKKCAKCSFTEFYHVTLHAGSKCKACGHRMSLTSSTYLNCIKLPFHKIYKLIVWVQKPFRTSSYYLAKICSTTQKTAWIKRKLILSVIHNNKIYDTDAILSKLLTLKDEDKDPIVLIDTSNKGRKFNYEDVYEIRRLYQSKLYSVKEIAAMYNHDMSGTRKIAKGKLYKRACVKVI